MVYLEILCHLMLIFDVLNSQKLIKLLSRYWVKISKIQDKFYEVLDGFRYDG